MRYLVQKLSQLLIVLVAVTFAVSAALNLVPNVKDRIAFAKGAIDEESRQAILDSFHLNDNVFVQYFHFVNDLVRLDFGVTITGNQPVGEAIWTGFQVSLRLMIYAQFVALLIAVPVAIWAAYRQGGAFDRTSTTISFGLLSTPNFILGPLLLLLFAMTWAIFPRLSSNVSFVDDPIGHIKHFFLPTIVLALPVAATYMRLLRADLVNTLQSDFITTARAKGLPTSRILFGHALRPSLFSLVTASAVNIGALIGGTIVVEQTFQLQGLGSKIVIGIFSADFRLVQFTVVIISVVYVIANLLVDLSYAWIDPRVRMARSVM
jgi:peptide/nickel transport system permease protein